MRLRSIPYTITFVTAIIVLTYPLLETGINWSYEDGVTKYSNRTGKDILKVAREFSFSRVPGIEPGWRDSHRNVESLISRIKNVTNTNNRLYWEYKRISGVSGVKESFNVNDNVGGYIIVLLPKIYTINDTYKSICYFSNLDSVFGSRGFTSNALGVVQELLALEEFAKQPFIRTPITVVVTDTRESGSNSMWNMFTLPEIQKCSFSLVLDSTGIANSVPNLIYTSRMGKYVRNVLPKKASYFRASNIILDFADTLELLSNSEISLFQDVTPSSSSVFAKSVYVDNHNYYHSTHDTADMTKANAIKARYDQVIAIGSSLSKLSPEYLTETLHIFQYSSYMSIFNQTYQISAFSQIVFVVIGLLSSSLYLYRMIGRYPATTSSGSKKSVLLFASQLLILCIVYVILFLWLSIDPLLIHKISILAIGYYLIILLMSLILVSLLLLYYSSFFNKTYTGAILSTTSILFGLLSLLMMLFSMRTSLNLVIPCVSLGVTNIPLLFRKRRRYRRKIVYSCIVLLAGLTCLVVNLSSACTTLRVVWSMISIEDTSIIILIILSFWLGLFPFLLSCGCIKLIYIDDDNLIRKPFLSEILSSQDLLATENTSFATEETKYSSKILLRNFQSHVCYALWGGLVCMMLVFSFANPYNEDQPVRIVAGIASLNSILIDEHGLRRSIGNTEEYGSYYIEGYPLVLSSLQSILPNLQYSDYSFMSTERTTCYLSGLSQNSCLKINLAKGKTPIEYYMNDTVLPKSSLFVHPSSVHLENEKINYTRYYKEYDLVIPERNTSHLFGFPFVQLVLYSTSIENTDSKVYANRLIVKMSFAGKSAVQSGYKLSGTILADRNEEMVVKLYVNSRSGTQVIIRVIDIAHYEADCMQETRLKLEGSFVFGGKTGKSQLRRITNYFINY